MRLALTVLGYLGLLSWLLVPAVLLWARHKAAVIIAAAEERATCLVEAAERRAFGIEEAAITRARRLVLTAAKVAMRLPGDPGS